MGVNIRVIAEFGQSHHGDVQAAFLQAKTAKDAGCWAVKWQIFRPENIASRSAVSYWSPDLGGRLTQLETFADNGMLSSSEWRDVFAYCREIGIEPMATPFDLEAVDLMEQYGVTHYKIASGDITYQQLVEKVAATGKPVFLSTGAANTVEISRALRWLWNNHTILLACTLSYPTAVGDAHLARIGRLRQAFALRDVGYSDHTLRTDTAMAAVIAGATVLEKHCTLNPGGPVPDDNMALRPSQLRQYVAYANIGAVMLGDMTLGPCDAEHSARVGARRSGYATRPIMAGETIGAADVAWLRPADDRGFYPFQANQVIGMVTSSDMSAGDLIRR